MMAKAAGSEADLAFLDVEDSTSRARSLRDVRIGIGVLIEETEALACVEQVRAYCRRIEAPILGVRDLSASQGMRATHVGVGGTGCPRDRWICARNHMIVAARANGVDAIDGPYADVRDLAVHPGRSPWPTKRSR